MICPVCRAENSTGPTCRRCRADLSLLAAVEARRDLHLGKARQAIAANDLDIARKELAHAERLQLGPDVRRLRACLFLRQGHFQAAWSEYRSVGGTSIGL